MDYQLASPLDDAGCRKNAPQDQQKKKTPPPLPVDGAIVSGAEADADSPGTADSAPGIFTEVKMNLRHLFEFFLSMHHFKVFFRLSCILDICTLQSSRLSCMICLFTLNAS